MELNINQDSFISGLPVKSKFGLVRFINYEEYLSMIDVLSKITVTPLHIFYMYKRQIEKTMPFTQRSKAIEEIRPIKDISVFEYVVASEELLESYKTILLEVMLDEEKVDSIEEIFQNEEDFMYMRKLIMDMNLLKEEKVSPNEEIQKFWDMGKKSNKKDNDSLTTSDIVTSIIVNTSENYDTVFQRTVFQVMALFYRIAAKYDFETSVTMAAVPSTKPAKIESWSRHINLFESDNRDLTMNEFNKQYGSLF